MHGRHVLLAAMRSQRLLAVHLIGLEGRRVVRIAGRRSLAVRRYAEAEKDEENEQGDEE